MSELVVTEFWEDGMCKGTLSYSDETIDDVMRFIGVNIYDVDDENELVSIELRDTSFFEAAIKVLEQMMKENKNDRWKCFLRNIPCLLSEFDSYTIGFRKGIIEYNKEDKLHVKMNMSDAKLYEENSKRKGYYLFVKEGKFSGEVYDLTKFLCGNPEDKSVTNNEEIRMFCETHNDRYRTLFKGMKNIENFIVKAQMIGMLYKVSC